MRIPADAPLSGLTGAEAARRLADEGPNVLPGGTPKSTWAIVLGVLSEPMFLMLLAAGAIYLALGDRAEALFLLGFVFVVIGITLAQERRTQRALEALRDLSAPRAQVLRDGQPTRIAGRDVVRGDVLMLHEGDRIAADAWLVRGDLSVDESLLTGEAVSVGKRPSASAAPSAEPSDALRSAALADAFGAPGGEGTACLFASTVVTRGTGIGVVTATGGATAVGRIGRALDTTAEPLSALQTGSRRLVRRLGVTALLLVTSLVLLGWLWNERTLLASLLAGIALAMAILPEEIPVILTVFLALGARRIARLNVLTRRIPAVEALGAITVLAADKTGTLTLNRMTVAELVAGEASFVDDGERGLPEHFHALAEFAVLATPADPFDPMERAIQAFGRAHLVGTEHLHEGHEPLVEYALSSEILAMTRVYAGTLAGRDPAHRLLATKGAPEAVADLCHLPAAARDAIRAQVQSMAERGLRVLGVARGRWRAPDGSPRDAWPPSQHDFDFDFLGLVGLADPPRPEVAAAIAECRRAGVRVIMMTGDHPATAQAIARQVGLGEHAHFITGAEIESMDDAALRARLRHIDVCARLQPAHKLRLVQVLRDGGEVVGMTGDGVNDAPALKAADVGIAMGGRGTDVAREAAALVLLDDSFASIVAALAQGRRIYDNIAKAVRFVAAVHVPVIALALVPALLQAPVLLLPVHIVLLQLLIDPACSIVFEAEPGGPDLMDRPPRDRGDSPFSRANLLHGALQGTGLAAVLLFGQATVMAGGASVAQGRAVVFSVLAIGVWMLTVANRSPHRLLQGLRGPANPWLATMTVGVIVILAAVLGVPYLRRIMGLEWPDAASAGIAAMMCALAAAWLALSGWVARHFVRCAPRTPHQEPR